jgi:hypothetical protein
MYLFAFGARIQCLLQRGLEIVHIEIDVDGSPMAIVPTNVFAALSRRRSRRLGQESDAGISRYQHCIALVRARALDKPEGLAIEPDAVLDRRNVN